MLVAAISVSAGLLTPALAQQSYPDRPVKIIVPWSAGSGIDVQVRQFARQFADALGATVVVENKAGAGSQVGYEVAVQAQPDGYTLFAGTNANFIHQYMRPSSKIDLARDMTAVSFMFWMPQVLVVAADGPAKDVASLISWAKENPGRLNYGSGGVGSGSHMIASAIATRNGLDVVHVPLRSLTAEHGPMLSRGDIHFTVPVTGVAAAQLSRGVVRALAVTSEKRLPQWPDVPTMAEAFNDDRYVINSWTGLFTPAGTPADIVQKLAEAAAKAVESPAHRASADTLFFSIDDAPASNPEEFGRFVRAESEKWRQIVAESGIEPH